MPETCIEYWLVYLAKVSAFFFFKLITFLFILFKCFSPRASILQQNLNNIDIGGKLWIREGVSGTWTESWASIYNRILYYFIQGSESILSLDIRKVILIKRNLLKLDFCNFIENSEIGSVLISVEGK